MAKRNKRPKVAFNYQKLVRIGSFIGRVRGIVTSFINNAATLGTPSPTTTVTSGHIDDLETAQDAVRQKTIGSTTTRDLKYDIVLDDMFNWQAHVQKLVDAETDPAVKLNIIALSGFEVKGTRGRGKPDLAIKPTITPGVVKLIAKSAGRRASYNWQQSNNNSVSWIDLPTTLRADLLVSGLTSKAYYMFRFRSITKEGTSAWSTPEGIVIQ